ncbi:hypothetical protein CDL15_Pgr007351 [Punica granatum]|uniref:Uncharacterized protein n=1 Tax=Punica granatum TaxID=22663 RepID=A0A218X8Q5_PUNGR|nr:hypothetical protein CDL15_Pgr007351 [Punica granatum]
MGDQEGSWARLGDLHCTWKGCQPKVGPSGRAYVIICGSGGLRSRGPYTISSSKFLFSARCWLFLLEEKPRDGILRRAVRGHNCLELHAIASSHTALESSDSS